MATRQLAAPPRMAPLYARAVAPLLPGASRLPWVAGSAKDVPDVVLALANVRIDPERVAAYAQVCGFAATEPLPPTYLHVLAFPLHMALMTDGRFPLAPVGLVHVANRIDQQRAISAQERLELRVWATPLRSHPRGRTFAVVSQAFSEDELVWEEHSTMLHRQRSAHGAGAGGGTEEQIEPLPLQTPGSEWRLAGDLGRRYGAVSGDRNPIHLHPLTAKALGFPRAIAHGMWTKARCVAALAAPPREPLPQALRVDVRFRRPILLPASVDFASRAEGDGVRFGVRDARRQTSHLDGLLTPLQDDPPGGGQKR
jgi:acyl dehydratase